MLATTYSVLNKDNGRRIKLEVCPYEGKKPLYGIEDHKGPRWVVAEIGTGNLASFRWFRSNAEAHDYVREAFGGQGFALEIHEPA